MELLSKTYQVILVLSVFFFLKTYQQYLSELRQEQSSDQVEQVPTFWKEIVARKEKIAFLAFCYMVLQSQYI